MTTGTGSLTQRPAWKALLAHHAQVKDLHLRELFAEPGKRGERLTVEVDGLYLDYSKNRVTDETLRLLVALAHGAGPARAASTRCSAATRSTSPRTAPCCTSRCARPRAPSIEVDGENVVPDVHAVLDADGRLRRPRALRRRGPATPASASATSSTSASAAPTSVPTMAYDALRDLRRPRPARSASCRNVDGTDFWEATHDLDPAETLFVVSSKTFTTLETLTNATQRARLVAGRRSA